MLPTKSHIKLSLAAILLGLGLTTSMLAVADPGPARKAAAQKQADTVIEFAPYVNVTVGKSTLLKLPAPAARISVANPTVADIRLINPREVYLLGKTIGSTNITLWSKSGQSTQVDVAVGADIAGLQSRLKEILPAEKDIRVYVAKESIVLKGVVERSSSVDIAGDLAEAYAGGKSKVLNYLATGEGMTLEKAVEAKINELLELPAGTIQVAEIGNTFVLRGIVSDAVKVDKAMEIAAAVAIAEKEKRNQQFDLDVTSASRANGSVGDKTSQSVQLVNRPPTERESLKDIKIINFLSVSDAQQVMLEVKVAEVSKNLLDKLGAKFAMDRTNGSWTYSILSNFLSNPLLAGVVGASKSATKSIQLDAQKDDDIIKILAEPNIMAISGQEGSFLAGGSFFIPVAQGGLGGVTLEEREFGVGLRFTPTVLEGGRINLRVAPEVSELSGSQAFENGGVSALLPVITTRRAATTVQLHDGQSFAIAGLIKNNITEQVSRFPVLGEIPILGALFRSSSFKNEKTELLFVITPRLVKPLPPGYALPTDHFTEPSRSEFFLEGKMEGKQSQPQSEEMQAPAEAKEEPTPQPEGDTGFEMK